MLEPVSVGLKFGFLAVLYLFLLWISRSGLKDLRRMPGSGNQVAAAPGFGEETGLHATERLGADPRLVVDSAPGHVPGMEYEIGEGATLGRGSQAEIRLDDGFASSLHARVVRQGGIVLLEDLGSTNGTYLNEELLPGPQPLHPGDRIRIGDSEFTYMDN